MAMRKAVSKFKKNIKEINELVSQYRKDQEESFKQFEKDIEEIIRDKDRG